MYGTIGLPWQYFYGHSGFQIFKNKIQPLKTKFSFSKQNSTFENKISASQKQISASQNRFQLLKIDFSFLKQSSASQNRFYVQVYLISQHFQFFTKFNSLFFCSIVIGNNRKLAVYTANFAVFVDYFVLLVQSF